MSTVPFMNFRIDKENKQVKVDRSFNAPIDLVWPAWTQSEILDQWWAPKPWKANTKSMNFTNGGKWLYAMEGPQGEKHWSVCEYSGIKPVQEFTGLTAFCDEEGYIKPGDPQSNWHVVFNEDGDATKVTILITFEHLKDLEAHMQMGFKEGFTMGLQNLDEYLARK